MSSNQNIPLLCMEERLVSKKSHSFSFILKEIGSEAAGEKHKAKGNKNTIFAASKGQEIWVGHFLEVFLTEEKKNMSENLF